MYDYDPRERKRLTSLQFLADRTNGHAYAKNSVASVCRRL